MASGEKDGKGYRARWRTPSGETRSKRGFRRKGDAERYAAEQERWRMDGSRYVDPRKGRTTFATHADGWQKTLVSLRPSSADRDRRYLATHVLPTFGPYELARIDHAMVSAWVAELSERRAPATVHKAFQILSKAMRAAVDGGLIAASPCERVALPKIERQEMRFLTPEKIGRLADVIGEEWRSLVLVGCYGGLRIGELFGLQVRRVDLLRAQIDVAEIVTDVAGTLYVGPPKTRASRRVVPVPRFVTEELAQRLDGRTDGLAWPDLDGGHTRVTNWRRRVWDPAVQAAGLAPLRPHDMRHTAVALWIASGASPNEIARRAGHSSVVTVLDRYGHLLPGTEDHVTDALDAMARKAANRKPASVTKLCR